MTALDRDVLEAELGVVRVALGLLSASILREDRYGVDLAILTAELERTVAQHDTLTARATAHVAEMTLDRPYCANAREVCRALFLASEASC